MIGFFILGSFFLLAILLVILIVIPKEKKNDDQVKDLNYIFNIYNKMELDYYRRLEMLQICNVIINNIEKDQISFRFIDIVLDQFAHFIANSNYWTDYETMLFENDSLNETEYFLILNKSEFEKLLNIYKKYNYNFEKCVNLKYYGDIC